MQLLAEVGGGGDGLYMSVAAIAALGVAIAGAIKAFRAGVQKGTKEAQQIGPQPFLVKMTEEFVTRREFVELKIEIRNDVTEMKGLFRETMLKVEAQNEKLSEAIEDGVKEGRAGRVALWNEVNPLGKEVAALKATEDVAVQIGKLSEAIKQNGNGKNTQSR